VIDSALEFPAIAASQGDSGQTEFSGCGEALKHILRIATGRNTNRYVALAP